MIASEAGSRKIVSVTVNPVLWGAGAGIALLAVVSAQNPARVDPLAFFGPTITLSSGDRTRLARGESVVKNLDGRGPDVAVMAASRTHATADRLHAWIRAIAALKAGPHVQGIRRLSSPPRLEDLADLTLDDDDLEDIRTCRPGDCGVRLSEREIAELRATVSGAGTTWKPAIQQAFRRLMLARAETYLASGLAGLEPLRDQRHPVVPSAEFDALLGRMEFLTTRLPRIATQLRTFPKAQELESFLYWSKEDLGRRPVVLMTHVTLGLSDSAGAPEAFVVSKQVYASHYMTGALAMTSIVDDGAGARYFVYVNRSRLDVFGGLFGGLVRNVVERRLRNEASGVVDAVRRRLEGGAPPVR